MSDDKTLKITDRRMFDPDTGEVRDKKALDDEISSEMNNPAPAKTADAPETSRESAAEEKKTERKHHSHNVPTIDLSTFVASLHTSAMIQMGAIPNPYGEDLPVEPELARQNIDILEMLEQKTKGNLTPDEATLLEKALYGLRMKYVEISKKQR